MKQYNLMDNETGMQYRVGMNDGIETKNGERVYYCYEVYYRLNSNSEYERIAKGSDYSVPTCRCFRDSKLGVELARDILAMTLFVWV